jgi:hypothetical protein
VVLWREDQARTGWVSRRDQFGLARTELVRRGKEAGQCSLKACQPKPDIALQVTTVQLRVVAHWLGERQPARLGVRHDLLVALEQREEHRDDLARDPPGDLFLLTRWPLRSSSAHLRSTNRS